MAAGRTVQGSVGQPGGLLDLVIGDSLPLHIIEHTFCLGQIQEVRWQPRDFSFCLSRIAGLGPCYLIGHHCPMASSLVSRIDNTLIPLLRRWSVPILRLSLALVFIWFGALKIAGLTPVFELVASTVYWVDPRWFVPAL